MSDFTDLIDLGAERLGGAVLTANDEFFAAKENLLKASAAVFREHEYTDRGKWMDGWETRRRRDGLKDPHTHDSCVIRLGLPGIIHGVVVDTSFFRGNYPESCSMDACTVHVNDDLATTASPSTEWVEILGRQKLQGDHKNLFVIKDGRRFSHLRLRIFPDGGVARLRVHGEVVPDLLRLKDAGWVDLAAVENGGFVVVCSDMFFGSRHNLILPGRPHDMSDGWETRRRRGPGHDWSIVRLGAPGTIRRVIVDTTHFKGNAPGRASLDVCQASPLSVQALTSDAVKWRPLLGSVPLQAHTVHVFEDELRHVGPVTHVRLSVFPDGGVARLRLFGELSLELPSSLAIERLNGLPRAQAITALSACCGSTRFCERMADLRPFEDLSALLRLADEVWFSLSETDWLEAFTSHPKIGEPTHSDVEAREQARVADASAHTKDALAQLNRAYDDKFGFLFLVCATGKSADELVALLETRLARSRAEELRTAMEEQAHITRLRLRKWLTA
jgi:allantoicase